jgi:2-desacetyl-2-hydroxyethyl bacteriochlorophyllide A dehydrogenase
VRAAVVVTPGKMEIRDVPEPKIAPDQIKVKIAYCGICGSDLKMVRHEMETGKSMFGDPPKSSGPRIMGHEASGTIVEVGPETKAGYKVGQCVAMDFRSYCGSCYYCRNKMQHFCERGKGASGSYAEYAVYNEDDIYLLPDNVSLEEGALLEPASVALHAVDLAGIKAGSTMAIIGGGPIGTLILEVARRAGAAKILVSEPVEGRRKVAEKVGANAVIDPTKEDIETAADRLTDGLGFDTVIDASGTVGGARQAVYLAGKCGTVIWAATYPDGAQLGDLPRYMCGMELTIRSVFVSPYCFSRALNLLPEMDLKPLISIKPLEQISDAFQSLWRGEGMKVLIKPG